MDYLIKNFNRDVNAVADDGTQPIHLACLKGHFSIIEELLTYGADVNAKIGKDIYEKYIYCGRWSNEFGDKMTLIAYAVINDNNNLLKTLLKFKPELTRTLNNKTLLMCALENEHYDVALKLIQISDEKLVNALDNNGRHAVHFLLPKKFGEFRRYDIICALKSLISAGADIHATVKGDPDTLLLNIAAHRGLFYLVRMLLPHHSSIAKSKALHYATLLIEDPQKYLRKDDSSKSSSEKVFNRNRMRTIKVILQDLLMRRTFGLSAPEEQQLMDQLLGKNYELKNFVQDYELKFVNKYIKDSIVQIQDDKISLYELAANILNDRTLIQLSKDELRFEIIKMVLFNLWSDCDIYRPDTDDNPCGKATFISLLSNRIEKLEQKNHRNNILKELQKIPLLRKFIPLPYEIALDIVEYLNNDELRFFIDSFNN